jgi:hypothetical protein
VVGSEPQVNDVSGRNDVWRSDVSAITTDVTSLRVAAVVNLSNKRRHFFRYSSLYAFFVSPDDSKVELVLFESK